MDLPDYVRMFQVAVTVENVPVIPEPATERAAGGIYKYKDSDTEYLTSFIWKVAKKKVGELKEILIISNDYEHTAVNITVGAVPWAEDWKPTASMPVIFEDLKLAADKEVKVEVRMTLGGTTIEVDVIIVGKEIGIAE